MWVYNGKKVSKLEQMPKDVVGFVYNIHNETTEKNYIGKKVTHTWKVVGRKKYDELKESGIEVKKTRKGTGWTYKAKLESDWLNYVGSNKDLQKDFKNGHKIKKEILDYASCQKQLTFLELEYQINMNVLREPENFYNGNILGKFFPRDINC